MSRWTTGLVAAAVLVAGCTGTTSVRVPTETAARTSPVTLSPETTSPLATSPVTTTPTGIDEVPVAIDLDLNGEPSVGTVLDVIDGDSLEVFVDGEIEEIRLEGINAPERTECFGDEARSSLVDLVGSTEISVLGLDRDQFGRLLAYVVADGEVANLTQIARGVAIATSFDHGARDVFLDTEETAFSAGIGLWASDACGPATDASVTIARVEPDPPGRDEDALAEEWVGIVNDGVAIDISGWVVRDESSIHRYTFPTGTEIAPGGGVVLRTGCGADTATELFWCADGPVWSNGGDTVLVLDRLGNVVDRYRYDG